MKKEKKVKKKSKKGDEKNCAMNIFCYLKKLNMREKKDWNCDWTQ